MNSEFEDYLDEDNRKKFEDFLDEGNSHATKKDFKQSIESFTKAIDIDAYKKIFN